VEPTARLAQFSIYQLPGNASFFGPVWGRCRSCRFTGCKLRPTLPNEHLVPASVLLWGGFSARSWCGGWYSRQGLSGGGTLERFLFRLHFSAVPNSYPATLTGGQGRSPLQLRFSAKTFTFNFLSITLVGNGIFSGGIVYRMWWQNKNSGARR